MEDEEDREKEEEAALDFLRKNIEPLSKDEFEERNFMGLSITKQIVGLHKGRLGIESEEDKGSVFWFIIISQNLSG